MSPSSVPDGVNFNCGVFLSDCQSFPLSSFAGSMGPEPEPRKVSASPRVELPFLFSAALKLNVFGESIALRICSFLVACVFF